MDVGTIFLVLLLLACPLMMVFMHRGGHAGHVSHEAHHARGVDHDTPSLDDLRHRRDELDAEIELLEREQPKASIDA